MTYRGQIKNGVVVLEGKAALQEGTLVNVEPVEESDDCSTLRNGLLKLAGKAQGLPSDMAVNHDHYLYGTPKRDE